MKRKNVYITSDSVEGKFNDIERALQLMSTKLFKTMTVIVPPIPLSVAFKKIPEDGEIFRGMFLADGFISKVYAFCESVVKDRSPVLTISVMVNNVMSSTSVQLRTGLMAATLDFPVPSGSRMTINVTQPDSVTGLWASALYEMQISKAAKEALAIDDLVSNYERMFEDASATEGGETTGLCEPVNSNASS